MGCLKLNTNFCNVLQILPAEKRDYGEKKCVNYYPFGLKHKGYNNVVNGSENKYQTYNGKELEEELGKNTLAYGWRDYDPAIGRFNKIDRFAEKYLSISPYNYTANNPIRFVDIAGDSINLGNLYSKNSKGELKNADLVYAFEIFASSKSGKKWIKDRAQKGFEINSEFIDNASFEANEEGSLSKQGIDAAFNVGNEYLEDPGNDAETDMDVQSGRLKISYNFSSSHGTREQYGNRFNDKTFISLKEILHETSYHGAYYENKFLSSSPSQRSRSNIYSQSNYDHILPINGALQRSIYDATKILHKSQSVLNFSNPKSMNYIYYNVLLKSINRGYRKDDVKN